MAEKPVRPLRKPPTKITTLTAIMENTVTAVTATGNTEKYTAIAQ